MRFLLALAASHLLLHLHVYAQRGETEQVLIQGQVVSSEDGAPVPRGGVVLSRNPGKSYNLRIREGRFSGQVPVGEGYWMMIWSSGYTRFRANNINVYSGMEPFFIELRPTRRISGQIVDPSGAGIAGARVHFALDPQGENIPLSVASREDGAFWIDVALDPGTYYLLVRHPLFEDLDPVSISDSLTEADGLVIELTPKPEGSVGSVQGRATRGGEVLSGVEVRLTGAGGHDVQRVQTDVFGAFKFADLAPGAYRLQVVDPDGGQSPEPHEVEVKIGEATLAHLSIEGPESVSGIVLGPSGDPLSGIQVNLRAGDTESHPVANTPQEREALERRSQRRRVSLHTTTDEQGRFVISGVMPGSYLLSLRCGPPRSDCPETFRSVEVPLPEGLEIQVEEALEMRAALLDGDGKAIQGFFYTLAPHEAKGSGLSSHVASLDGLFVIRGLKRSTYSIEISLGNGREAKALIDLNLGTDILLKMPAIGEEDLIVEYVRQ